VDASDPEAIADLTSRYTIVVPDALTKFPVSVNIEIELFSNFDVFEVVLLGAFYISHRLRWVISGCKFTVDMLFFVIKFYLSLKFSFSCS